MYTTTNGKFHGEAFIVEGFVFVDEEKNMYGVREASSREGRVWHGAPDAKNAKLLAQFGLQARPLVVDDFGDYVPVNRKLQSVSRG